MTAIDTDVKIEDTASAGDEDTRQDKATPPAEHAKSPAESGGRQIAISLRGLMIAVVIAALTVACGVLGWLYAGEKSQVDANAVEASNTEHAENIAIEYAVNAAEMDYQDFVGWKAKLVNGTSPELKDKLSKAADSMEQVLAPLQWKSSARPLAAKVRSSAGGIYTVDAFVSVLTKTMQAPEGLQSTATYNITIDSRNDWQITDVGGVDAALGK